jgi:ParB-like chromosome segregation protein Spo0J
VVGILAVDSLDDALWSTLRALAAGHPIDAELRRRLTDTLDKFGVAQAIAATRRGATRADVVALLRRLSCIDEVVDNIEALGAPARYQRVLDAVAELETLAVTDRRIREFLSRDDTVVARMMAAVDVVEAVGMDVDRGDTAAAHLRRAVHWQRYRRGPVAATHRACGADIVRGSLRLWTKAGGAA